VGARRSHWRCDAQCWPINPQDALIRVNGTIAAVVGNTLTIRPKSGHQVTVRVPDKALVMAIIKASLGDIKPNSYIETKSVPQPDGTLRASEIGILPEAFRGAGEGHSAFGPNTTLTNGTVTQSLQKGDSATLTVKYKDAVKTVIVSPDTEITAYVPGEQSDLKVDAKISIVGAIKKPGGVLERGLSAATALDQYPNSFQISCLRLNVSVLGALYSFGSLSKS
jgi:hypothetical protein